MTTIKMLQRQGPPHWYSIPLPLHYKAASKHGVVLGSGQARMMSSQGITIAAAMDLNRG